jgi:hypothetical protein
MYVIRDMVRSCLIVMVLLTWASLALGMKCARETEVSVPRSIEPNSWHVGAVNNLSQARTTWRRCYCDH